MRSAGFCLGLLLLAFWQAEALAHRTSLSRLEIDVAGREVTLRLRVSAHDLAVALGIETDLVSPVPRADLATRREALARYLGERLQVRADGSACRSGPPDYDFRDLPENVAVELRYRCAAPVRQLAVDSLLFLDIDADHRSLVAMRDGAAVREFLLQADVPGLEVTLAAPAGGSGTGIATAMGIFISGIEHILAGFDHLLFLLALLLARARLADLVKIVTAFTLGHSLTLGLAWFGLVTLPGRLVESLIAASIAYVAAENILRRGHPRRWAIAGGLGLVHGLGFYGVLQALDLGGAGLVTVLAAFNLGVEAGQLLLVLLALPLLRLAQRHEGYDRGMQIVSAGLIAIAGFWVVERLTGN